jgi:hypothetical protein
VETVTGALIALAAGNTGVTPLGRADTVVERPLISELGIGSGEVAITVAGRPGAVEGIPASGKLCLVTSLHTELVEVVEERVAVGIVGEVVFVPEQLGSVLSLLLRVEPGGAEDAEGRNRVDVRDKLASVSF